MSAEALRWGRWQNVEGATQGPCGWSHTGAWCASGGGREAVVRLTAQPPCACAFLPEGRKWALGGLVSPQLVGCGVGAGFTGGGRIQGQCISLFTRESRCCPNFTPPPPRASPQGPLGQGWAGSPDCEGVDDCLGRPGCRAGPAGLTAGGGCCSHSLWHARPPPPAGL